MQLFYDPTEARDKTRLPANVISAGKSLPGLERETGADLLLSPLSGLPIKVLNVPGLEKLKVHCQAGVLIQRKSGMDFFSSIGHLMNIQWRMQQWGLGWLLITGNIGRGKNDLAYMDGRRTHVSYQQMIGALDYWQLRGGGITVLQEDALTAKWIALMCDRVEKVAYEPEIEVPPLRQKTVKKERNKAKNAAVQTLMCFPGIGEKWARIIADEKGTLAKSMEFLSGEDYFRGLGPKTRENARAWLGLKKGESLCLTMDAENEITGQGKAVVD